MRSLAGAMNCDGGGDDGSPKLRRDASRVTLTVTLTTSWRPPSSCQWEGSVDSRNLFENNLMVTSCSLPQPSILSLS